MFWVLLLLEQILTTLWQVEVWVQLLSTMGELFSLLEEHPEVHFVEGLAEEEENLEVRITLIYCQSSRVLNHV